jgi:hypothetical protein
MEWISIKDRLPNKKEQEENWKFLVCHQLHNWTDAAYYDDEDKKNQWNNGECSIIPTHWQLLPSALVVNKSCDTCENLSNCRFWAEVPENGRNCKLYIKYIY